MKKALLLLALALAACQAFASEKPSIQGSRATINLEKWNVWIDKEAKWQDDELYLPGQEDFTKMPVNAPTCGWDKLLESASKKCTVPATIEELFSEGKQTWTFRGVCWYVREVNIPKDWKDKTIRLAFEQTRQRAELYVNGKLCGYDIVSETPWDSDITQHLKFGEKNQIAVRITNASGGGRGWEDYHVMSWGKYKFPQSNDFTGIGGRVSLIATDATFIEDVFVKNLLPAKSRKIEINITLNREAPKTTKGTIGIIHLKKRKFSFANQKFKIPKGSKNTKINMTVEDADLWDIDTPVTYECFVSLNGKNTQDKYSQTFGFRTVELTDKGNGCNFYINNKRVRFRSAIDWGFYRGGGMYASDEQARKSVAAARAIGHNALNFHRKIGLPRIMEEADKQGLYIYEEPGGFHTTKKANIEQSDFAVAIMMEKVRRMVIRDRNHPSLVTICLCNEDDFFTPSRKKALKMVNEMNDSILVYNSSGWMAEPHYRPYSSELRHDYYDEHTVKSDGRFRDDQELAYWSHRKQKKMPADKMKELPFYWGEVRCITGPANYYQLHEDAQKGINGTGYDYNLNKMLHEKLGKAFKEWDLANTGSRDIKSPADISTQMGRGLMYADGRLSQKIMATDYQDGYAINGWSQGPRMRDSWMSAICDEGRNVKGPPEDYAYWCRPLQVAIFRQKGNALKPGSTTQFLVVLINEGILKADDYKLKLWVTDGKGKKTSFEKTTDVKVLGGDVYAQDIFKKLEVKMDPSWHAGHITIHGELLDAKGKVVADGAEQVLLQNRISYKPQLSKLKGAVLGWPGAKKALEEAGAILETPDSIGQKKLDYVVAASTETIIKIEGRGRHRKVTSEPNETVIKDAINVLEAAKNGATAIIHFDKGWAKILHENKVLSEPVTQWGGKQWGGWKGSGWGYINHFLGDQIIQSKSTFSTKAWGMVDDPVGFYPFASEHKIKAYGAYIHEHRDLLALIGEISYGKGKIILAPGYPVDQNHAFNDLLFFNMILK